MAFEHFDYDPLTGVTEYVEFSADGKTFSIRSEQDVQPYVDFAKFLANTGGTEVNFRKEGWLYAIIPPVVQAQMFKRGINILDQTHTKAVVKEINTNYPYLKTTHRNHAIK